MNTFSTHKYGSLQCSILPNYMFNVHLSLFFLSIFICFLFCMVILFFFLYFSLFFWPLYISFLFSLNIRLVSFFFLIIFCFPFFFSLFFFDYLLLYMCLWVRLIIKERKFSTTHICRLLFISFAMLFFSKRISNVCA